MMTRFFKQKTRLRKHNFILLCSILLFTIPYSFSQIELSENDLNKLKAEIELESNQLRKQLEKEVIDFDSEFNKTMTIDFRIDTFKIESFFSKRLELDYSTAGMIDAFFELEKSYDELLNKYYQILLKKLNKADQEILKKSQRNWIVFRDSERLLNSEISKEEYSGGGTLQNIIIADKNLNITKKRVVELVDFCLRIN